MKKIKLFIQLLLLILSIGNANAQTTGLQFSIKAGYDKPFFNNNTPYIDYNGGLMLGVSADYYFSKWGIGADIDYMQSKPKSTLPTNGLVNAGGVPLTTFALTVQNINRLFYGIGPSYKLMPLANKFQLEVNTRVGLGSIKGGRLEQRETTTLPRDLLNFHAGYNLASVLSTKVQFRGSYAFSKNVSISGGAYFINHFKANELADPVLGIAAQYQPIVATVAGGKYDGGNMVRTNACKGDVSSVGGFIGLVFKFGKNKKAEICLPEYGLAVTARDKYTGELLSETEVVVKNTKGEIVQTGITNNFGVVVFEKMMPEDYNIEATLAKVQLDNASATKNEFLKNQNKVVQKQVVFGSLNFIVKGKIVECNSTKGIANINVVISKADLSFEGSTLSKEDGSFLLQVPQGKGEYSMYGKKGNYYSQIETINPANYDRNKNLFIKLELCAQSVECGQAIQLKNILFDLDKYVIKEEAKKELNKLVQFMKDNPSIRVELGSHTDCRNTAEYNQTLSQNRANASVDYVVSQGISRNRLVGTGYGETKLLNKCADGVSCAEAEHSINRRTEMKVICNK